MVNQRIITCGTKRERAYMKCICVCVCAACCKNATNIVCTISNKSPVRWCKLFGGHNSTRACTRNSMHAMCFWVDLVRPSSLKL